MEIELCRICLADGGIRMYPLEQTRYNEIFEWHTEEKMDTNYEFLLSVCYLCNAVLNRVYEFLKQMISTEIYLKMALRNTTHKLTYGSVEKFKREMNSKPHNLSKICLPNTNFAARNKSKDSNKLPTGTPLKLRRDNKKVRHVAKHTNKVSDGPKYQNQDDQYKDQVTLKDQDNTSNDQIDHPSNKNTTKSDRDRPLKNQNRNVKSVRDINQQERNKNKLFWRTTVKLQRLPMDIINKIRKKNNSSKNENNEYWCAHCDYKSTVKFNLQRHLNVHDMNKQFACKHCQRRYRSARHLLKHACKKYLHKCRVCNKEFRHEISYWRHFFRHA